MIAREEDLGPRGLLLQKMRLEYVYRLEEGSREGEGESDGGNSQRKQVGPERRDWSWTEEVPPPQARQEAGVAGGACGGCKARCESDQT